MKTPLLLAAIVPILLLASCAHHAGIRSIAREANGKLDSAPPGESTAWSMILLGEIDGRRLVQTSLNDDPSYYFYPASSIKLLAAIAAVEKLNDLRAESEADLTLDTPMVFEPLFPDESRDDTDETNLAGGTITLGHEIRKLFIVSDNRAFNRLFEFVGHDEIHRRAQEWGLENCRTMHRLAEARSPEDNRRSPRVRFILPDGDVVVVPERTGTIIHSNADLAGTRVGKAWVSGDTRHEEPFDFTQKNFCPLADLQLALAKVVRPDLDLPGRPLDITDDQRSFLMDAMRELPRESRNPIYNDREKHPDDFVKFLLPGIARVVPAQDVQIFNKIGLAYGYVTENAYVLHTPTGRSFFVASTIYGNPNETLNDGDYSYDTIHLPFMADLGEALARRFFLD